MILKEGGAKVVERLFSPNESRLSCVIAPPDTYPAIIERTKKLKIPLLSPEWIIQSLFHGYISLSVIELIGSMQQT